MELRINLMNDEEVYAAHLLLSRRIDSMNGHATNDPVETEDTTDTEPEVITQENLNEMLNELHTRLAEFTDSKKAIKAIEKMCKEELSMTPEQVREPRPEQIRPMYELIKLKLST